MNHMCYDAMGHRYSARVLWRLASDKEPQKVKVEKLLPQLKTRMWGTRDSGEVPAIDNCDPYHHRKVERADLMCPIILHEWGYILDGAHRLKKAHIYQAETILAVGLADYELRYWSLDDKYGEYPYDIGGYNWERSSYITKGMARSIYDRFGAEDVNKSYLIYGMSCQKLYAVYDQDGVYTVISRDVIHNHGTTEDERRRWELDCDLVNRVQPIDRM